MGATSLDCDWAEAIRPSVNDILTEGTKKKILAFNEAGVKNCGWKP